MPILKEALAQAKAGRALILKSMLETIPEPRAELSIHAPKIKTVKIDVEKIGELIGPGGKIIKKLIAETGAQIDVADDGTVHVSGIDSSGVESALEAIENITKEVKAGETYEGEVVRIENFGAFVNILPGRDGMVHVSDMSTEYVSDPREVVSIGDRVQVRVKEIDNMKRINLSMVMDAEYDKKKESRARESRPRQRNSGERGGRRYEKNDGGGGPHFPASRLASKKGDRRF